MAQYIPALRMQLIFSRVMSKEPGFAEAVGFPSTIQGKLVLTATIIVEPAADFIIKMEGVSPGMAKVISCFFSSSSSLQKSGCRMGPPPVM